MAGNLAVKEVVLDDGTCATASSSAATPTRRSATPPSATDVGLGYKQLVEVGRGWRDLKTGARAASGLPPALAVGEPPRFFVLAPTAAKTA